ncbi:MAG: hypothetical protein JJ891_16140 [Rhizobiaceae bacterium]|jgi:hypothetical protein|nr:hypothetical protein [Rhizobiaceae bacterium]
MHSEFGNDKPTVELSPHLEKLFDPKFFDAAEVIPYKHVCEEVWFGIKEEEVGQVDVSTIVVSPSRQVIEIDNTGDELSWLTVECGFPAAQLIELTSLEICFVSEADEDLNISFQIFYFPGNGDRQDLLPGHQKTLLEKNQSTHVFKLDLKDIKNVSPSQKDKAALAIFLDTKLKSITIGGIFVNLI